MPLKPTNQPTDIKFSVKVKVFFSFFVFFDILSLFRSDGKLYYATDSRFLLMITRFSLLVGIRGFVISSKSEGILCLFLQF